MKNKQPNTGLARLTDPSGLVYSTDAGRMCPDCRQPMASCSCKTHALPKTDGVVRVSLQTKGRGGKIATIIKGLPLDATSLAMLGKQLRAACGSGGTVKDGVVEVQGDHVAIVIAELQKQNYNVKRVGDY